MEGDASSRLRDEAILTVDEFDEHVAEVLTVGLKRGPTGSESQFDRATWSDKCGRRESVMTAVRIVG